MPKNQKIIIVTGTPGTGKTTIAKKIAKKLGYAYIDVNKVIKKYGLSDGYDRKRRCKIIDTKRLCAKLLLEAKRHNSEVVIDSHLSHHLPAKEVKLCIVTKCELKTLKKRLVKRGYHEAKIKENLQCEIFDVCLEEARESGHKVLIAETDKKEKYEKNLRKIK